MSEVDYKISLADVGRTVVVACLNSWIVLVRGFLGYRITPFSAPPLVDVIGPVCADTFEVPCTLREMVEATIPDEVR